MSWPLARAQHGPSLEENIMGHGPSLVSKAIAKNPYDYYMEWGYTVLHVFVFTDHESNGLLDSNGISVLVFGGNGIPKQ